MPATLRKSGILILSTLLLLSGCANQQFINPFTYNPASEIPDTLDTAEIESRLARLPDEGQRVTITDVTSGRETMVTFGEPYFAASGRFCSLYYTNSATTSENTPGLTCQNENGKWVRIPRLINARQ